MADFLYFLALCLVVLGGMWLAFVMALRGSVEDPSDPEEASMDPFLFERTE